jgi:hypothetical protein
LNALKQNKGLTWALRFAGFLALSFSISLIFRPIVILASVIPILGRILNFGANLFAGFFAAILSLMVIGIAWLFYRPFLGLSLLAAGVLIFWLLARKSKDKEPVTNELNRNYVK